MIIHRIVGVPHKDCPSVGREVKKRMAEDEAAFVLALENAWETRLGQSV